MNRLMLLRGRQGTYEAAMINNLGYTDIWDSIESIGLVEEAFDVKVADAEAEKIVNVGDLYDLLLTKISVDETNKKCASAVVFYRLRRAFAEEYPIEKITPSYNLSGLDISVRKLFGTLAKKSNLTLPNRSPTWMRQVAWALAVVCFYGPFAVSMFAIFFTHFFKLSAGLFVAMWIGPWLFGLVAITALYNLDPGRLPEGCETLGGLSKKTVHLNFGGLQKVGVRQRNVDVWDALVEVLSSFNDFPADQINRDTFFYKSTMKDHLKRVA